MNLFSLSAVVSYLFAVQLDDAGNDRKVNEYTSPLLYNNDEKHQIYHSLHISRLFMSLSCSWASDEFVPGCNARSGFCDRWLRTNRQQLCRNDCEMHCMTARDWRSKRRMTVTNSSDHYQTLAMTSVAAALLREDATYNCTCSVVSLKLLCIVIILFVCVILNYKDQHLLKVSIASQVSIVVL